MCFFRLTAGVLGVLMMLAVNLACAARSGIPAAERERFSEFTAAATTHATAPALPALRDLESDDDEIKAQPRWRVNEAVALRRLFPSLVQGHAESFALRSSRPESRIQPRPTLVGVIELRI